MTNKHTLLHSLIINEKFPSHPKSRERHEPPSAKTFFNQKELISIVVPTKNLNVSPAEYEGRKLVPLEEIDGEKGFKQIYAASKGIYKKSIKDVKSLKKEELKLFKILYQTKTLKNYIHRNTEDLRERIAIMIEGNNLDNKEIGHEFEEELIKNLKDSYGLESYL